MSRTSPTASPDKVAIWVRLALVALGLPNIAIGAWAIAAPQGWYDRFPGFDPRLIAAEPPYNAHLSTDAGAGLLASGVVLLLAAWLADSRSVLLAIAAFAAFAVPHAGYHLLNPAPGLSTGEDVLNVATLAFAVVAVAALALVVVRQRRAVLD